MSVSLVKGQKVSLSKEAPGLKKIIVGLGWDAVERPSVQQRPSTGGLFGMFSRATQPEKKTVPDVDCDASAILLKNGRLENNKDIVYFANLQHKSGAVWHHGDNLTGEGDGDDEQIEIDLMRVPREYDRIVIVVNIYSAQARKQDFGLIENAFVRILNGQTFREILRYDLSENYPGKTAMIFGEIYRYNGEWKFAAIGQGTNDGSISEIAHRYKKTEN